MNQGGLTCLVGKNGVGKTTLIRAIKNMISADTFSQTASPYIFRSDSSITYRIDNNEYHFNYNPELNVIDTRNPVPRSIRENIEVELPIPDGIRFSHFRKLSRVDERLRSSVSLGNYSQPQELIEFLNTVYGTVKFEHLREVTIGREKFYLIPKDDDYYIREDYLSSGEYFLIHLYKLIRQGRNLIAIDEIDISLDASAQANLVKLLREVAVQTQTRIVFTTHSMALMKTMEPDELFYMSESSGIATIEPASYNYVKSALFGFTGWDKYVLTEDKVLESYIHYLIDQMDGELGLCKFKIIPIGTASSVINLMKKNNIEGFLGPPESVVCILDGDQRDRQNVDVEERIWCIPYDSIEAHFHDLASTGEVNLSVGGHEPKSFYRYAIQERFFTQTRIFELVSATRSAELQTLKDRLINHISL